MKKQYRQDLEKAARQMILVHKVDTLSRLILRTIMRNIKVRHVGIFLFDKSKNEYIVKVSKGRNGAKIPVGFTKVKNDNPIIQYFTNKGLESIDHSSLLYSKIGSYLKNKEICRNKPLVHFLHDVRLELSLYQAKAFIPGFYRNNLVGLIFLGAKDDNTNFTPEELSFLSVLASDVVMSVQNAWLFEDLTKQLDINKKLFLNTVTALTAAIDAKDKYTMGHTERVAKYSLMILNKLNAVINNKKEFEENLSISALLHDIGKIGIPGKVLNKAGALTKSEQEIISYHPITGANILSPINEFKEVILGVKYHHEHYDGSGYPFGLSGKEIPLIAAIISVADSFDAMTSDRPYRKALSRDVAIDIIKQNKGRQFDPEIVNAFLNAFEISTDDLCDIMPESNEIQLVDQPVNL